MTLAGTGYVTAALLAVVFWVAGTSKLRAPDRVAEEFVAMGIRSPELAARVLPAVELIVAVLLVAVPWVGATFALALLVVFTVVLVRVVRSGAVVPCACFGAVSQQPASWLDVARNVALMAAAAVALGADRVSATAPELVVPLGAFVVGYVALRVAAGRVDDAAS